MKYSLSVIALMLSLNSFASNEEAVKNARECFDQVGAVVSIGLSQRAHGAPAGSKAEKKAKKALAKFNDYMEIFPMVETACNEGTETQAEAYQCYIENYAAETKALVKKYKVASVAKATPECSYLAIK